jgi:hypothetical protein
MTYRDKVVSTRDDIHEGQSKISEESQEREAELAAIAAAKRADGAIISAQITYDTIHGVNWMTREKMNLREWSDSLDIIEATPEQRQLFEEAKAKVRAEMR